MAPNKATILIVDPCSMTRQCLTVLLNAKKYAALSTPSIRDALEIIKVNKPDLIIHECELPDGPAEKLIQLARAQQTDPSPNFLMLTSCDDQSKHLAIIEQRVTQIIVKREFTIKQFYAKVDAMLGDKRFGKPLQIDKSRNAQPAPQRPIATGPKIRTEKDREELYRSIPMLLSEEEVEEHLGAFTELKALSPTAAKVIDLASSDDSTLEAIADAIRSDPAIAVKMIQIANSAAYARGEPVTTPLEAVRRLGLQEIRQTMINIEIIENFSESGNSVIDPRLFWEHSIAVAAACAMIAKDSGCMDPDLAYTAGLLHDVGRVIMSQSLSEDYPEVIQFSRENQLALDPIEKRMFGVDHATVMDAVLKKWDMVPELIEPIVHHHKGLSTIEIDCPDRVEPVAVVSLADRIVHALGIGCSGNLTIYPTEEYFAALELPDGFIERIAHRLPQEVDELRTAMLGGIEGDVTNAASRLNIEAQLRPQYITRHAETDAIQFWVNSLRTTDEDGAEEPPNLFVVRLRTKRDAIEAEKTIQAAELKYERGPIPVIAISDSGSLNLTEVLTSTRDTRLLTVPFTVDEFERCLLSIPELAQGIGEQPQAA